MCALLGRAKGWHVLLGRDDELVRLARHLAGIRSRAGTALALVGEPGIGKTALLQWAAADAAGMRVLRATGVESEVELAFSGLAELCMPILEHLDEIPPPQRTALSGAFALEAGTPGDRFALAMGAVSLRAGCVEGAAGPAAGGRRAVARPGVCRRAALRDAPRARPARRDDRRQPPRRVRRRRHRDAGGARSSRRCRARAARALRRRGLGGARARRPERRQPARADGAHAHADGR